MTHWIRGGDQHEHALRFGFSVSSTRWSWVLRVCTRLLNCCVNCGLSEPSRWRAQHFSIRHRDFAVFAFSYLGRVEPGRASYSCARALHPFFGTCRAGRSLFGTDFHVARPLPVGRTSWGSFDVGSEQQGAVTIVGAVFFLLMWRRSRWALRSPCSYKSIMSSIELPCSFCSPCSLSSTANTCTPLVHWFAPSVFTVRTVLRGALVRPFITGLDVTRT